MSNKKVDQFVHLHTHTHFSILDGHDTIEELVAEVSRLGQPAVAVTDHGSLSGLYDLYNAAKKAEITPIAGCEFYMTPSIGSRLSREPLYLGDGGRDDVSGRGAYTHITVLAENNIGLKNLFQLSLKASSEGFYQKPRCLLAGQEIVTRNGIKKIEDVKIGDEVLTHNGRFRKVIDTMVNNYEGLIYGIKLNANYSRTTWLTDEHPVLIRNRKGEINWVEAQNINAGRSGSPKTQNVNAWKSWVALPKQQAESFIDTINTNDYIDNWNKSQTRIGSVEKINIRKSIANGMHYSIMPEQIKLDKDFGYILGLYIAEGWTDRGHSLNFTFHKKETEYVETVEKFFMNLLQKTVRIHSKNNPDYNGVTVSLGSSPATELFTNLAGSGAKNKHLPSFIYEAPREFQEAIFKGIMDGDGSYYDTHVSWGQTSENLAWQVRMLAVHLYNAFPSLKETHDGNNNHSPVYTSNFPPVGREKKHSKTLYDEKYVYRPVSEVETKEYNGLVYNIEVEEDNSYVTDFIVHNCDLELLEEHREGLIVTTGCPSGEVQTWLRLGHPDKALAFAARLQEIFGKENVFMELMEHGMAHDLERGVRSGLLEIATKLDMPLVATNDLHYATLKDRESHEQMLAIQTRSVMSEPPEYEGGRRFAFEGGSYYVKSADEMASLFPDHPDALKNTLLIAERSSFEVEPDETLRPQLPGIPEGETEASWLRKEAYKGLAKRLPDKVNDPVYIDRLNMELEVLELKGFSGYFLVVSDFVKWGKFVADPPVPTGYGRGSAAGSLVAFVMDITDADPIRFDLLFERFINPERDSPPDIDMDFNDTDRERVVEYVKEKYGIEYVAHVATFGKIGAKTAIKDVVRILERPYAQGDALSKALPPAVFGKEIKLSEVYDPKAERYHEAGEFRDLVEKEKLQDVIESALKLEGRTRSIGVHAAALVISSRPVVETIPMFMRQNDGAFITQWDYPTAEALGLLKVDFLGLRNLGVISNTIHHIKATRGQDVDLQEIIQGPMDDVETYKLLQRGDTLGVFQLDGCLAGNTLVSGRKIKDLYKNYIEGKGITSTYSIDLSTGERKRNGIVRFVESGIKMVYRLVSESGRMIEATADHKFMTDSGWKRLGDIDVLVDRVLVDHTVKTLMYRECLDCGTKINSEQRNNNKRCYKCSAKFHSNPSKKASREAIAAARIKFYENGGEPWNKGLNKDTNPILAEVSRKVRAKLNGRNLNKERLSESEYLDYISEMSERMSGKNNPMYGKTTRISKRGYREDLGHYVRSSWEADYARVLNFLEEPYKYEPDTFELTRVDGSTMTYTPDFYLVNEDRYVEIKGFMRDIDAEKIKLVQEQHGIKVDVIAQSEFAELELEYKDLVAWECPEIPKSTNWENIISITQIGKQMTYDITMEAPLNNFLANGFMVHNSGMRKLLKQLKPTEFEDISAVLSLYRPGPMGVDAHTDYALRKNGLQAVTPIHPEFKESLADILGPTYNLVVYQEQVQRIAQRVAGYSLAQADLLRRAMGKKKRYIIDAEFVPFSEGAKANGYSDEAIKALWDVLVPFADYAFNKCVSDRTKIRHVDGTAWTAREIYNAYLRGEEIYLQAMWSDGEIRPHKVERVVSTGVKTIVRVKTADNRTIEVTPDHRLLTTRGYIKVEDMIVGKDELIVGDKIYSDKQRENAVNNIRKAHGKPVTEAQIVARRNTMLEWNHGGSVEREALNVRASERMREYQAGLSFEDRSNHQKHVNEITDRGERVASIMREKRSWLYDNDEEFRKQTIEHLAKVRREGYSSGSGFGKTCYASNGMLCDSLNEQRMAEFLIELGIDFEMHKPVGRGECDFYFEGLYWEMDGMDRHISYFERKYGDIPFIVVTPEDYRERISTILNLEHARNGDLIVAIDVIERKRATIDIEMADGGPKNYVTWKGIVSHNSHTVGYGLISYVTAYLKANYPSEFMSALLSSVADDTDKTALYLNECKHMGITVYAPAVSRSVEDYRPVSETEIYFGLKAIRGMGAATAEEIVKARGDKPFTSFSDFMHRMPDSLINKRVLEGLAQGGGFDDFGIPRKSLIAAFPDMLKAIQKARKKAKTGMMSLFDDDEDDMLIFNIMDIGEYTKLEKLKLERHALGLYVSDHPLNGLQIDSQSDATVYDLTSESIPVAEGGWGRPQKLIKVSGIITSLDKKRTKAGSSFAVGTIEDMTGGIPFAMFSKVFEEYGADLKLDGVYQFSGQHRKRSDEDEIQFIIDSVRPLDFGEHGHLNVKVRLTARQWLDGRDKFLKRLEKHHMDKGSLIQMSILDGKEIHDFTLDGVTVKRSPQLIADIRELFGIDAIGRWRSVE